MSASSWSCLVVSDHLGRPRRLLTDEHIAVLDLEALGEPPGYVDERAFDRSPPGARLASFVALVVWRRLAGWPVLGKGHRVGRRLGDDRAHALRQHQLGRRVTPLPMAGQQLDHADAFTAQHERQRQPAALDLGGRAARSCGIGRTSFGTDEQRFPVADHASRGGVGGERPRAADRRAHAAHVVAGDRLERVAAGIDQREHGGRAVHGAQQTRADQRQAPVGAELVERPRRGVDQRQERLGS